MKRLHFVTFIQAPREKVWDIMLADATYREWVAPFHPGSYFKGTWEEGTKMYFLGPWEAEGQTSEGGMVSMVKANRQHEFVSLESVAVFGNNQEDSESEEAKKWIGGIENYAFTDKEGGTELVVDTDVADENADSMEESWKQALAKLKEISEAAA